MPLFDLLAVYADATPRGGADQMALDEALLETCARPVLRIYRWDGPAVSFGYSQSLAEVRRAFPELPLVRRWTGGGIVEHGRDWTFSLIVPAGEPFAAVRPAESYRQIHEVIAAALGRGALLERGAIPRGAIPRGGCDAGGAATDAECRPGFQPPAARHSKGEFSGQTGPNACFVQPVRGDVLANDGRKVCGGAQRRTRTGFLHQGSVQNCEWPSDMTPRVAAGLSARIDTAHIRSSLLAKAKELAAEKYGSAEWTEKKP